MRKDKKKKSIFSRTMAWLFGGILAVGFIGFVVSPDRTVSQSENRGLAQRPRLSLENILSGDFEEQWDDYVNDQFPLRDLFVSLRSQAAVAAGRREAQGIYLGKHQELLQKFAPYGEDSHQKKLAALGSFAGNHKKLKQYMLVAPTAVQLLKKDLPTGVRMPDQKKYIDRLYRDVSAMGITPVDVSGELSGLGENAYYHTDHHWTSLGAFQAAQKTLRTMRLDPSRVTYTAKNVCDQFRGQLSYQSGMCAKARENIDVYFPDKPVASVVNYVEEQKKSASLYETDKLDSSNAYEVFMGGNHSLVKIVNAVDSRRVLLMFKDSYANCFIPFLTPYFKEIVVVDPRYYYDDVQELIEAEEVTDVLYLYNANTFFTDNSLTNVLSE